MLVVITLLKKPKLTKKLNNFIIYILIKKYIYL